MRHPRPAERPRPCERPEQSEALRALLAPRATPPLPSKPEVIDLDTDEDSGGAGGPCQNPDPEPSRAGAPRAYVGAYSAARLAGGGTPAAGGTAGGIAPGGGRGAPGSGALQGAQPESPLPPSTRSAARSAAPAGPSGRVAGCEGDPAGGQGYQAGGTPARTGGGERHEPPWFDRMADFVPVAAIAMRDGRDPRCAAEALHDSDACASIVSIINVSCLQSQHEPGLLSRLALKVHAPASN